jgi:hypothetical protein
MSLKQVTVGLNAFQDKSKITNANWNNSLNQPITICQGDTIQVRNVLLDTRKTSTNNILIPQDIEISLDFYFYWINRGGNQQPSPYDASFSQPGAIQPLSDRQTGMCDFVNALNYATDISGEGYIVSQTTLAQPIPIASIARAAGIVTVTLTPTDLIIPIPATGTININNPEGNVLRSYDQADFTVTGISYVGHQTKFTFAQEGPDETDGPREDNEFIGYFYGNNELLPTPSAPNLGNRTPLVESIMYPDFTAGYDPLNPPQFTPSTEVEEGQVPAGRNMCTFLYSYNDVSLNNVVIGDWDVSYNIPTGTGDNYATGRAPIYGIITIQYAQIYIYEVFFIVTSPDAVQPIIGNFVTFFQNKPFASNLCNLNNFSIPCKLRSGDGLPYLAYMNISETDVNGVPTGVCDPTKRVPIKKRWRMTIKAGSYTQDNLAILISKNMSRQKQKIQRKYYLDQQIAIGVTPSDGINKQYRGLTNYDVSFNPFENNYPVPPVFYENFSGFANGAYTNGYPNELYNPSRYYISKNKDSYPSQTPLTIGNLVNLNPDYDNDDEDDQSFLYRPMSFLKPNPNLIQPPGTLLSFRSSAGEIINIPTVGGGAYIAVTSEFMSPSRPFTMLVSQATLIGVIFSAYYNFYTPAMVKNQKYILEVYPYETGLYNNLAGLIGNLINFPGSGITSVSQMPIITASYPTGDENESWHVEFISPCDLPESDLYDLGISVFEGNGVNTSAVTANSNWVGQDASGLYPIEPVTNVVWYFDQAVVSYLANTDNDPIRYVQTSPFAGTAITTFKGFATIPATENYVTNYFQPQSTAGTVDALQSPNYLYSAGMCYNDANLFKWNNGQQNTPLVDVYFSPFLTDCYSPFFMDEIRRSGIDVSANSPYYGIRPVVNQQLEYIIYTSVSLNPTPANITDSVGVVQETMLQYAPNYDVACPLIGASEMSLVWNAESNGIFQLNYAHTPIYSKPTNNNSTANVIESVGIYPARTYPLNEANLPSNKLANPAEGVFFADKQSGILLAAMNPPEFWSELGFDVSACISNPPINDLGAPFMTFEDFLAKTTGGFNGLANNYDTSQDMTGSSEQCYAAVSDLFSVGGKISNTVSTNAQAVSNSVMIPNYLNEPVYYEVQTTHSIDAVNPPLNPTDSGHYLVEITGFQSEFMNSEAKREIKALISNYFINQNSFATSNGADTYIYAHQGEPIQLSSLKVRILNPVTGEEQALLGPNSSIYLQVNKEIPKPTFPDVNTNTNTQVPFS